GADAAVHGRGNARRQTIHRYRVGSAEGVDLKLLETGERDGTAVDGYQPGRERDRVRSVRGVHHQGLCTRAPVNADGRARCVAVHRNHVVAAEGVDLKLLDAGERQGRAVQSHLAGRHRDRVRGGRAVERHRVRVRAAVHGCSRTRCETVYRYLVVTGKG